jgi:hypothetical protein
VLCLLEMQSYSNNLSEKAHNANFCEHWPPFRLVGFSLALKTIDCNPFLGYGPMQVIDHALLLEWWSHVGLQNIHATYHHNNWSMLFVTLLSTHLSWCWHDNWHKNDTSHHF